MRKATRLAHCETVRFAVTDGITFRIAGLAFASPSELWRTASLAWDFLRSAASSRGGRRSALAPRQDYLARLARFHHLETLQEVGVVVAVRDDGADVELTTRRQRAGMGAGCGAFAMSIPAERSERRDQLSAQACPAGRPVQCDMAAARDRC